MVPSSGRPGERRTSWTVCGAAVWPESVEPPFLCSCFSSSEELLHCTPREPIEIAVPRPTLDSGIRITRSATLSASRSYWSPGVLMASFCCIVPAVSGYIGIRLISCPEARLRSTGQSGLDGRVRGNVRRNNAGGFPLLEMILLLCKCSHAVPYRQRSSSQAIYHAMLVGSPMCRRVPGGCILRNKKVAAQHPSKRQPAGIPLRRRVVDRSTKDNQ